MHPKKNILALLEAWSDFPKGSDWRLVIAGWDDGGHELALKNAAARLNVEHNVEFVGPVYGKEKDLLFRSSQAFVLPSLSEGLPMAVLEAWSYGLPVLMTEACHIPEGFLAEAAIKIAPPAESIRHGLIRALVEMSDHDRRVMGARGRALVKSQFSWHDVGSNILHIYEDVTHQRRDDRVLDKI
jgi:poly(glycerol-phosphate) alpha-glucosyltransferase